MNVHSDAEYWTSWWTRFMWVNVLGCRVYAVVGCLLLRTKMSGKSHAHYGLSGCILIEQICFNTMWCPIKCRLCPIRLLTTETWRRSTIVRYSEYSGVSTVPGTRIWNRHLHTTHNTQRTCDDTYYSTIKRRPLGSRSQYKYSMAQTTDCSSRTSSSKYAMNRTVFQYYSTVYEFNGIHWGWRNVSCIMCDHVVYSSLLRCERVTSRCDAICALHIGLTQYRYEPLVQRKM